MFHIHANTMASAPAATANHGPSLTSNGPSLANVRSASRTVAAPRTAMSAGIQTPTLSNAGVSTRMSCGSTEASVPKVSAKRRRP